MNIKNLDFRSEFMEWNTYHKMSKKFIITTITVQIENLWAN